MTVSVGGKAASHGNKAIVELSLSSWKLVEIRIYSCFQAKRDEISGLKILLQKLPRPSVVPF